MLMGVQTGLWAGCLEGTAGRSRREGRRLPRGAGSRLRPGGRTSQPGLGNGECLGHRKGCGSLEVEGLRRLEAPPPLGLSQSPEGRGLGSSVFKLLGDCKECAWGVGAGVVSDGGLWPCSVRPLGPGSVEGDLEFTL